MKILIYADEIQYLNDLKYNVKEYMHNRVIKFDIDTATSTNDLVNNNSTYDLAFLDIKNDGEKGVSLAKNLINQNKKIIIFFITSLNKYQDTAMDLRVFRFFERPYDPERLYSGLDKAIKYIDKIYVDYFLKDKKVQTKILIDNILYIEYKNRHVILNESNGQHITRETLDDWNEKLPHYFFYRVHKSFLVNLHCVDRYEYKSLYLNNGMQIPIASRKQSDFYKYWSMYVKQR